MTSRQKTILAVGLWLAAGQPSLAATGSGAPRRAPVTVESIDAPGGLRVEDPGIVDRSLPASPAKAPEGRGGEAVALASVEGFEFTLSARGGQPAGPVTFFLSVISQQGKRFEGSLRLGSPREGETLRIPIGMTVTPDLEGAFTARLSAVAEDGGRLFEGTYGFGYPRYSGIQGLTRIHEGAPIRDDFEGDAIDEERWRIWLDDPGKASVEARDGRVRILARGWMGYNGLVSRAVLPTRDVEAVCLAGVSSDEPGQHPALVHLCGSHLLSPDNWLEVSVQRERPGSTLLSTRVSVPPRHHPDPQERLRVEADASEGLLVRIISDPAARLVRGMALVEDRWIQIGTATEVPARVARLEIKTEGFRKGLGTSTVWFDDCRLYPRPETHDVTVRIERPGGGGPAARAGGWPMVLFDASNRPITNESMELRLYDEDGTTLVDAAQPGPDLTFATFSLEGAPWEIYPAGAILRVFLGELQIGGDMKIERKAVEGLYPDDVFLLTLE